MIAGPLAAEHSSPERRIAVAICNADVHPLALAREHQAPPLLAHIAQARAFTCVACGTPTDLVRDRTEAGEFDEAPARRGIENAGLIAVAGQY